MKTFTVRKSTGRFREFFFKNSPAVPAELFSAQVEKPDCSGINYPLPSRKKDYTCFVTTKNALWLGADNGLTRYNENAEFEYDKVMYFSAPRELPDNKVLRLYCDDPAAGSVWVETETGVAHITLRDVGAEEKGEMHIDETVRYVDRHGMTSQKTLTVPYDITTAVRYGHCDNSGLFTSSFALGELFRYATLKRERGENDEKVKAARAHAIRALEAHLLLMYLPSRGDGFVARTFVTKDEPLPDDGLFYRINGNKATVLPTTFAKQLGVDGMEIDASVKPPERLSHLYRDEGYTDDDIIYKGDTSSDEITGHMVTIYFAHNIIGKEDPELDELMLNAAKATLKHIIDNGCRLHEPIGRDTTWAKWDTAYFSEMLGWSDGCLNACQILMYHKLVMEITGETEPWQSSYDKLVSLGYEKLVPLHGARFHVSANADERREPVEELMYGDHTLFTYAYSMLIHLEKDESKKEYYRAAYRTWNDTVRREHNPMYDLPFMYSCPDDEIDTDALEKWFRRCDISRIGASPCPGARFDIPLKKRFHGDLEYGALIPNDEYPVSKHDRNPFQYQYGDTSGHTAKYLENGYLYNLPYWFGRYVGIITEEENG